MKILKITLIAVISSVLMVLPSHSVEFRLGVSGGWAQLEASGSETLKDSGNITSTESHGNAVIPSFFAELAMENGFGIGIDSITGGGDLAGSATTNNLNNGGNGVDTGTNKANAEVDGILTTYLIKTFSSGFYVKAGISSADVNTIETLSSGSVYGNKSIDGTHYGVGFERTNDSGIFFRTGVEVTDFDTLNLIGSEVGGTSGSFNKIKADVDVTMAKLSVGKKF